MLFFRIARSSLAGDCWSPRNQFCVFFYLKSTSGSGAFSARQRRPSIAAVFAATRTPIGRNLSPENQGRNGICTATSVTVSAQVQSSAKAHCRPARIDHALTIRRILRTKRFYLLWHIFLLPTCKEKSFLLESVSATENILLLNVIIFNRYFSDTSSSTRPCSSLKPATVNIDDNPSIFQNLVKTIWSHWAQCITPVCMLLKLLSSLRKSCD